MKIILIFFVLLALSSFSLRAQEFISATQDFSTINVAELSDEQIEKIKIELLNRNVKFEELLPYLSSKGMTEKQFKELSLRIQPSENKEDFNEFLDETTKKKSEQNKPKITKKERVFRDSLVFGHEIFNNSEFNFEPNQSVSTPQEYIVDIGDELQISIYGTQQFSQKVVVNKEGIINLTNIGNIKIGGLQFGSLRDLLKKKSSAIYNTLKNGGSELSVSIINYKSIQVTIIGAVNPGNYLVSSMSTVFNALHAAGGPGENASYRNIELIRGGSVFMSIDLYSFLCSGDNTKNINLKNGDIIRIPGYVNRVKIEGEAKKTGVFELLNYETFGDLLKYCSGFSENAFSTKVLVTRNINGQKKLITLLENDFSSFEMKTGDLVNIDRVLSLYQNKISVKGAVYRPGNYEFTAGMKLLDLIFMAEGVKEDAFLNWIVLSRESDNLIKEIVGVNLKLALENPNSTHNIALRKGDELIISSVFEMQENQTIDINGEVLNPGTYPYSKKMKLLDAIQLAKGFKESASNIIEVSRLKNQEVEIFRFNYSKNKVDSINMELKPFDMISVRKNINFNLMKVVTLKGEFSYPGDYSIARENERVSDVLKRCEGLTKRANKFSVRIERRIKIIEKEDSLDRTEKEELIIVPINYTKMIRKNAGKSNPIIRDGDVIIIDQLSEVVKVSGEVELTSEIPLRKAKNAKYYINAVGGFKETALKKSVYVIYANGVAKQTKRFLGIRFYPKPTAGSNIVVTKKSDREKKLDTSEIIGLSSILSTITAMTVAIINQITP